MARRISAIAVEAGEFHIRQVTQGDAAIFLRKTRRFRINDFDVYVCEALPRPYSRTRLICRLMFRCRN